MGPILEVINLHSAGDLKQTSLFLTSSKVAKASEYGVIISYKTKEAKFIVIEFC